MNKKLIKLLKELRENDAMKFILKQLDLEIEGINYQLLSDKPLTEQERNLLLERRRIFNWLKNILYGFDKNENRFGKNRSEDKSETS